jgi:hypothetical protein
LDMEFRHLYLGTTMNNLCFNVLSKKFEKVLAKGNTVCSIL